MSEQTFPETWQEFRKLQEANELSEDNKRKAYRVLFMMMKNISSRTSPCPMEEEWELAFQQVEAQSLWPMRISQL